MSAAGSGSWAVIVERALIFFVLHEKRTIKKSIMMQTKAKGIFFFIIEKFPSGVVFLFVRANLEVFARHQHYEINQ
jgi:hypothetical protein